MFYTKVRKVLSPTRGTSKSAGIDFYVPEFTEQFLSDLIEKNSFGKKAFELGLGRWTSAAKKSVTEQIKITGFLLYPQERVLIPSGIHVNIPEGFALIAHNKSGIGSKHGLDRLAEVVDEDYQGEVHLSIFNSGINEVTIMENMKLIQFILIPVLYDSIDEVPTLQELYPDKTERGEGGFGHTGH